MNCFVLACRQALAQLAVAVPLLLLECQHVPPRSKRPPQEGHAGGGAKSRQPRRVGCRPLQAAMMIRQSVITVCFDGGAPVGCGPLPPMRMIACWSLLCKRSCRCVLQVCTAAMCSPQPHLGSSQQGE